MREKYESLPVATLRDLAKAREMVGVSTLKKAELVEAMLEQDERDKLKTEKAANASSHLWLQAVEKVALPQETIKCRVWRFLIN